MNRIDEMARIGWIPSNQPRGIEVYVHTDDSGNVPHFHIRKYGTNNNFEWETCIRYDSPRYFAHGKYHGKIPTKLAKELDKMFRQKNPKSRGGQTFWEDAIDEWNRNNSEIELPIDLEQPDYTQLNHNEDDLI